MPAKQIWQRKESFLWSFGRFCVPLSKIPLFWFCVMFVRLSQMGENQFILCETMKGRGVRCLAFYMVQTTHFRKKEKIEKIKFKNRKIKKIKISVIYVCVCARGSRKIGYISKCVML